MTGWETLKMWTWDDHDRLGLSDLSDMTVWHECAFREHTSVHDQYRERVELMFEDRVIRNCPKNRYQVWGESGRLKWTDWVAGVSGLSRVCRWMIWEAEMTRPSLRETFMNEWGDRAHEGRWQNLSETEYREWRGEEDRQIGGQARKLTYVWVQEGFAMKWGNPCEGTGIPVGV